MTNELIEELKSVNPEHLTIEGKKIFEVIMKIIDERDDLQKRVNLAIEYCNNNIEFTNRLIDIISILKGSD